MNPKSVGTYEVKVRLSLAFVLFFLCVGFILAFYFLASYRGVISFSAAVIGGSAAIYSAFFAAQSLRINLIRQKLDRSMAITHRVGGRELTEVRGFVFDELSGPDMSKSQVVEKICQDKEISNSVRTVLNHFEDISIYIQKGHCEEEAVYKALSFLAPKIFSTLKPYIDHLRTVHGSDDIYIEAEKMVKCWESGKYVFEGCKIPKSNA
jgi:hypothetical protein